LVCGKQINRESDREKEADYQPCFPIYSCIYLVITADNRIVHQLVQNQVLVRIRQFFDDAVHLYRQLLGCMVTAALFPEVEIVCPPFMGSQIGIAFFYRAYDGKVPAAKTVSQVISENAGLSLKNVVFVSDKGYSDAKNINDCLRNKLGFLFNVQCAMPDSFAQELIDGEKENLRDLNRMDWLTKVFQITKEINWTFESDLVEGQVTSKKTKESTILYWHIYFNRQFVENARQGLIERIDRVREKIYNGEELDENELTLLEDVFEKHEEGDMISYTISNEKVDQKLRSGPHHQGKIP